MKLSYMNQSVLVAYTRGYRVTNKGDLISFTGRKLKLRLSTQNYYRVTITVKGKIYTLAVHKLQAYQKYGDEIFKEDVVVRHLDGNSLNNSLENINIGTHTDNMRDKDPVISRDASILASTTVRVLTDKQIMKIRKLYFEENWTYKQLMGEFNVTSKGSMWEFIHRKYVTKK